MGGGPRDVELDPAVLKRLESLAKDALRRRSPQRNVFISYSFDDTDTVNALRAQASNESTDLNFNDRSQKVPFDSTNADYIRRGLRELIRNCSVTFVYVSPSTANSRWVDWEIRESVRQGKRVIAVHSGSSAPNVLPPAVAEFKVPVVRWTHRNLLKALE